MGTSSVSASNMFFRSHRMDSGASDGVKRHASPHAHFSQCMRVPPLITLACMAQDERRRTAQDMTVS